MTVLYTHAQLVDWLENAAENDPAIRKEMSRIFQQANRRIQNLETSMRAGRIGYSPAYGAVIQYTGTRGGRFSKFHMVASWDKMLEQTAQAMAFLNEETSTASGARKWQRELSRGITHRDGSPISDKEMSRFMKAVYGDEMVDSKFRDMAERYIMSNTEMAVGDAYSDMDSFINEYVENTERQKREAAESMADYVDSFAEQMFKVLNRNPFHEI